MPKKNGPKTPVCPMPRPAALIQPLKVGHTSGMSRPSTLSTSAETIGTKRSPPKKASASGIRWVRKRRWSRLTTMPTATAPSSPVSMDCTPSTSAMP
ncbi:hypothetical protein STENM327S_01970 [Streptomyces tendae]